METQNFPVGSRFCPTKLGLVRRYLRNMVESNNSDFITTLDVYSDDPWLLDHVNNDLFYENEWYYFVPRTKRAGKTSNRTVRGRGESEGGTWKSIDLKKPIIDKRTSRVEGYKQTLVYNKTVKGKLVKTDWRMTEYSLHMDVHDDLVLCRIQDKTKKNLKRGFVDQVPHVKNNILSNQVREEEAGLTDFANGLEMEMLEEEHGDVTQQQQQQQQQKDTPIFPSLLQGHDSGLEGMMTTQSNENNVMMMPYQENYQWDDFGFDGSEDLMLNVDELIAMEADVSQQQQHEAQIQLTQDPRRFVGQVILTSN